MSGAVVRRRRLTPVVLSAVAVVAVGAAAVAAAGFGGTSEGAAGPATLPPETATVDRETLRDVQTEPGTLGYGTERTLDNRLSGTVTGLAETGSTVARGETLYEVDEDPVVLMYGSVPAYRALAPGAEGADVAQLERNLAKLGYTEFTVDGEFTSATASAVEAWQADLGLAETGAVEPGRVVFASGPVRVGAYAVALGDVLQPGQAVVDWTGTEQVVTVELELADAELARKGRAVTIELPDGTELPGAVSGVQTVIVTADNTEPGEDGELETVLEVTVSIEDREAVAGYQEAAVEVGFVAGNREDVLTVPVAALLALREGGYGVEVIEGATSRIVAVETGLFAGGRVEVSGDGLTEGLTVGMPS